MQPEEIAFRGTSCRTQIAQVDPCNRNLQLIREGVDECGTHSQTREPARTRDTRHMREITVLPPRLRKGFFREHDQLMIANTLIDHTTTANAIVLNAGKEAGMTGDVEEEDAHENNGKCKMQNAKSPVDYAL